MTLYAQTTGVIVSLVLVAHALAHEELASRAAAPAPSRRDRPGGHDGSPGDRPRRDGLRPDPFRPGAPGRLALAGLHNARKLRGDGSTLKAHCRDVGRDYDTIEQVVRVGILVAENEREIERLKRAPWIRSLNDIQIVGTPAQVTETMLGIVKQGARRLTVNFADVPRPEGTWLFASTVLPHL
jgi:hypothetical protein